MFAVRRKKVVRLFFTAFVAASFFCASIDARAESLDELKRAIEQKNQEIARLEQEAKKFRQEIVARQEAAKTLSGELARIDRVIGQLRRDIALAKTRAQKKEFEIRELGLAIAEKQDRVASLRQALGAIVRLLAVRDQEPLLAVALKYRRLSDFFAQADHFLTLEDRTLASLDALRTLQSELADEKSAAEEKQQEWNDLRAVLADRRAIQESERRARGELLTTTKNQEREYQKLLQDREKKRSALESEIRGIEEKIRITIDPSLLPSRGRGVLGFPLSDLALGTCAVSMKVDPGTHCITQYFGNTSFAAAGGYNGRGHNGMDFRAEIGTPVLAAEEGIISAVGDTDAGCRGASYGKWILIKHPSNLSTLYTHLSSIGVSAGDRLTRGGRIGYSGMTGYATGPHLHFTVFATQGVRVDSIVSRVCGRTMILPISALNGYLNPLDYL